MKISRGQYLDEIVNKKHSTVGMRLLSYFFKKDKVDQEELIKELFGRVDRNKRDLFFQKIALTVQLIQVKKTYGIYIRTFSATTPYCKLLNTKEDFEILLDKIHMRIDNLESEKDNVKDILKDINKYNNKVKDILEALKERDKYR